MKTPLPYPPWRRALAATGARHHGFSLLECLVYIGVMGVLITLAAVTFWHATRNNEHLRRNASDIVRALQAGERWREDIRGATGPIRQEVAEGLPRLAIPQARGAVHYLFRDGAVWRQAGERPALFLADVLHSRMDQDRRQFVTAWKWEVELKTKREVVRVRPLFTFEAPGKEVGR